MMFSMERILDRYERCSYAGEDIPTPSLGSQVLKHINQYLKYESLFYST